MRFGKRSIFTAALMVLALAVMGSTPAFAEPGNGGSETRMVTKTIRSKAMEKGLKGLEAKTSSGQKIQPFADPPLGGCDWQSPERMLLQMQWWYTNNVLSLVESDYRSNVLCTATAPGQTLKILTDVARLNRNLAFIDNGNQFYCQTPPQSVCLLGQSIGDHACAGSVNCAGTYQLYHFTQMTLPDGWIWTSWPDTYCADLDQQQTLVCYWYTDTILVPVNG